MRGIPFVLAGCFIAQAALAEPRFVPTLPDFDYSAPAQNEGAQILPIPTRINEIIHPTLGFPSLVSRGGTLSIILRLSPEQLKEFRSGSPAPRLHVWLAPRMNRFRMRKVPEGFGAYYGNYSDFQDHNPTGPVPYFRLTREAKMLPNDRIALRVKRQELMQSKLLLTVEVPHQIPDFYQRALDLEVEISRSGRKFLHDVQHHAVGMLQGDKGFRFIHFADPQLHDPELNLLGWENIQHPDLSGQKQALEQAVKEMNFLRPDFGLVGGDLVGGRIRDFTNLSASSSVRISMEKRGIWRNPPTGMSF